MKRLAALALLACSFAAPVWAANVAVSGAFARASLPGSNIGVVYMTLQSDADDQLTGVSTPVAAGAMLHQTTMAGMVMSMDMVHSIDLPAGKKVALAPDHFHIMLQGLKAPLVKGSSIPLHLIFAHAPAEDISVPVASFAAIAPGG